MAIFAPFAHPLYVMLKPVGAVCNLACSYCYYLEKSKLYKDEPKHVMNDKLLEKFTFSTFTSSGTFISVAEKFQIPFIPASTKISVISWTQCFLTHNIPIFILRR